MSTLHAVLRSAGERWEAYSAPVSIYAGGPTREQARREFREAAAFHFGGAWDRVELAEHVERAVAPGVFARAAVDRRSLDRLAGERLLRSSLEVPDQLAAVMTRTDEIAATGDHIFVVCVLEDRLEWVTEQIMPRESLHVCLAAPGDGLWWTTLSGAQVPSVTGQTTLEEVGLDGSEATVADMVAHEHRSGGYPSGRSRRPDELLRGRALVAA